MIYQVWAEGYAATGETGGASFVGEAEADTFREACVKVLGGNRLFNEERLTYWGCHLFDNLHDAQRSFG